MQIYYINLARRTDRRAFMEAQFTRLGLAATRIEAVTPEELSTLDQVRQTDPMTGELLPDGAYCCGLSHLRALGAMTEISASWSLILEDDAVLSARLPTFLQTFEADPPAVALVRIEAAVHAHLTLWRTRLTIGGMGLHRYTGHDIGAAAYLICDQAARAVLASTDARRYDIDVAMFSNTTGLSRQLRPVQLNPALCIQAGNFHHQGTHTASDLNGLRRPPRSALRRIARVMDRDVVQATRKAWHRFARGATRTRVQFQA